MKQQQRQTLQAIIGHLRRANEAAITLGAEDLEQIEQQAASLADAMEAQAGDRQLEHWAAMLPEDLNAVLPCSPMSGRFNPIAPPLELSVVDGRLVGSVTLGNVYEGPEGHVHGAVVAGLFDQLLALAPVLEGRGGPTINLTVEYLRPTPIHVPLRFESGEQTVDGNRVSLTGQCIAHGEVITRAQGVFKIYTPR